jgi:hypothetical protein
VATCLVIKLEVVVRSEVTHSTSRHFAPSVPPFIHLTDGFSHPSSHTLRLGVAVPFAKKGLQLPLTMLGLHGRPSRKSIGVTAFFFTTALFYLYATTDLLRQDYFPSNPFHLNARHPRDLPCRNLPGANDTVVILKTGSTEFQDKLPIQTTS